MFQNTSIPDLPPLFKLKSRRIERKSCHSLRKNYRTTSPISLAQQPGKTTALSFSIKPFLRWATTKVSPFDEKQVWWLYSFLPHSLLTSYLDWQPTLKPRIPSKRGNFDHLYRSEDEATESRGRPSNQQQGVHAYISPDTSGAAVIDERMGPPSTSQSDVKTPRPDIFIGLKDVALNESLQSRGLAVADTEYLLEALAKPHPQTGHPPLLHSEPTQAALHIRFPCFIVEGKSYATCRTIYEAQNQAAVSGACSLKILHDLDNLVHKSNPGSYSKVQPIVFSVCTEGPIHQLWVHYTIGEHGDGNRMYYMAQVKTCDMGVCDDNIVLFLEAVDNVLKWGSGEYKEAIAEQLSIIWQHHS